MDGGCRMSGSWGNYLPSTQDPERSESNASYTFSFVAGLDPATHGLRQASCHFRGYPAQGRARAKKGYSECTIRLNLSTSLGVIVRFYNKQLKPTLKLDEDEVGALIINHETIGHETLYEYDGVVLRLLIAGRLPEDAFKTAGVLSIVDLLGKSISVRPIAEGRKICPQKSIEHDCDEHLLALLHAVTVEDVAIHFPASTQY